MNKVIKFFASLGLAVFIISALAVVAAVGTITEAKYNDSEMAVKLVYQSPWMYAVLGLLIIQLIAVMIDRWPWRSHHAGFVFAHVGIIILLFGAWITQQFGIDGSMVFEIGQQSGTVSVKERDLIVYGSLGGSMRAIFQSRVDFLSHPPTEARPLEVGLGTDVMIFREHLPFAFRESEIDVAPEAGDAPALRVQLENANVNLTQWLRRDAGRDAGEIDLGPAKLVLTKVTPVPSGRNEVIFLNRADAKKLTYVIFNKDKTLRKRGEVAQGDTIETGWMGLKVRLLRYLPHARENVMFRPAAHSTPATISAARFSFRGRDYWVGLDTPLRIYLEDRAYIVVYGHAQVPLSFALKLTDFTVGKYQGTDRAASYESRVQVPGRGEVTISMNEPLQKGGYTFYQSSFVPDERGKPVASILSVNYDPGRWIKYLGSMLIVLGSCILFWFKRVQWFKLGSTR